jgi:hypothetical protein
MVSSVQAQKNGSIRVDEAETDPEMKRISETKPRYFWMPSTTYERHFEDWSRIGFNAA